MSNLEVYIANLLMNGEKFSINENGIIRDITVISCTGFKFTFKQLNPRIKHSQIINTFQITTLVTIQKITHQNLDQALNIIDDICLMLSLITGNDVIRASYTFEKEGNMTPHIGARINPKYQIINLDGKSIHIFIDMCFAKFRSLKLSWQLNTIIGYLCEANRTFQAIETKLILHYVVIENLKHTFALENGYIENKGKFSHPDFPPLITKPVKCDKYQKKGNKYVYELGSSQMTREMVKAIGIAEFRVNHLLTKRNKMIHEGVLLPIGDPNYVNQAIYDYYEVNDFIREYLLKLLNYQDFFYLNTDRFVPTGKV